MTTKHKLDMTLVDELIDKLRFHHSSSQGTISGLLDFLSWHADMQKEHYFEMRTADRIYKDLYAGRKVKRGTR